MTFYNNRERPDTIGPHLIHVIWSDNGTQKGFWVWVKSPKNKSQTQTQKLKIFLGFLD